MDLFNPADRRPVHFVGIGGAGMSALALIACRRGVAVSGCDADPTGAADLSALGVTVHAGHDPAHLDGARAVVVTAAVPADHPELAPRARAGPADRAAKGRPGRTRRRARRSVAVSGTHGKTTTTVMTTEALTAAGLHPTGIAGRAGEQPGAATRGSPATSSSWSRPTSTTRRSSRSTPRSRS